MRIPKKKLPKTTDGNGNSLNCPICFENYRPGDLLKEMSCCHNFHDGCIDQWLANEKRCPVCNQDIDIEQLI